MPGSLNYPLDALAGSLWHKIAGVSTPRQSPRHRGGQPCVSGSVKIKVLPIYIFASDWLVLPATHQFKTGDFLWKTLQCIFVHVMPY